MIFKNNQPKLKTNRFKHLVRLSLLCCLLFQSQANANITKKYQMIADYLIHFTAYTEWPLLKNDTVNLCILGIAPFNGYLQNRISRSPTNRVGLKVNLMNVSVKQSLERCNIVYIDNASDLTSKLKGHKTLLTVGNRDDFISRGGIVNFYSQYNKIRVEVNITALESAQLTMRSELLKHAKITTYKQKNFNHG